MPSDFSKQFRGVLKSIRSTINPEYAIPEDRKNDPVNVRILRIKNIINETKAKMHELNDELEKIETNLNGLIEELHDAETNLDATVGSSSDVKDQDQQAPEEGSVESAQSATPSEEAQQSDPQPSASSKPKSSKKKSPDSDVK